MLIQVASYPRSGNRMIRGLIQTFFERPTTEVYKSNIDKPYARGEVDFITNWRYPSDIYNLPLWWHQLQTKIFPSDLNLWIALYDLNVPPYTKNCRYLVPGCLNALTPKNRQHLASEESIFFVKTHEFPYPDYFDGEYVIQMVRHPGFVFSSYKKFIYNYMNKQDKTIEEVIRGKVQFGSWSNWHQAWEKVTPSLKEKFLQLRYEDVRFDKIAACEKIKSLIGVDYKSDNQETSFEDLQKHNPKLFSSGKVEGWQQYYTSEEIELIWDLHGVAMQKLGYEQKLDLQS